MGSRLAPIFANLFKEEIDAFVLENWKSKCWLSYADDTFVVRQYEENKLLEFFEALNMVHGVI